MTDGPANRGEESKCKTCVCVYCKDPHSLLYCNGKTDPKTRLDIAKKECLCFNC